MPLPSEDIPPLKPSFYMRPLPTDKLIGYETPEGKALFRQALEEGTLESFFPLSQQFLTQSEPAYCGIGTLCMILNALRVDPKIMYKSPWRWFSEDMLDCCRPLSWIQQHGITLPEFACLASCNGLSARTFFADRTPFSQFHADVVSTSRSDSRFLALSYSRASLGQTGTGHFSPAGGYCSANGGMVLVLDVARFKYPSYWVPVRVLYDALVPVDEATGHARGWSVLRRRAGAEGGLVRLNATPQTWGGLYAAVVAAATAAGGYEGVVGAVGRLVGGGTGVPPVVARVQDGITAPPPEVERFYEHVVARSDVYRDLRRAADEMCRVEVAVFVLALFGLADFLAFLRAEVRAEVVERARRDLEDARVGAEVGIMRFQMEGLVTCGKEEEAGGCAGRKAEDDDRASGCCRAR